MSILLAYIQRVGIEFDIAVNVLFGGQLGQTVSYRCAVAARAGRRWGCVMCWFLNWAVQRNHCADQFTDAPTPWFNFVRAGIAFGVGIFLVSCVIHFILYLMRFL